MQRHTWAYSTDFSAGTYTPTYTVIDTAVHLSQYGHPAIEPAPLTFAAPVTGAYIDIHSVYPLSNGFGYTPALYDVSNLLVTQTAGDQVTITTTALQVAIQLTGNLLSGFGGLSGDSGIVSGAIRHGALASIFVDGVLTTSLDCYNNSPFLTLYLDGASHVIRIMHSGTVGLAPYPISAIVDTTGSSIAAFTALTLPTPSSCDSATLTVTADDATHYTVTAVYADLTTATLLTSVTTNAAQTALSVSGAPAFGINITGTLVPGDTATFTTDASFIALEYIQLGTAPGGGSAVVYTSDVFDSGDKQNQWFELGWDQATSAALTVTFKTGNTSTPDGSWTSTDITPIDYTLPDSGVTQGVVGLSTIARSRYCQWIVTFSAYGPIPLWARDVRLYYWTPERDKDLLGKLALGSNARLGPNIINFFGVAAVYLADLRQSALDLINSFSISTAVDQYLAGYGEDLGLPRYSPEPPESYRTRLTSVFHSLNQGGSIPFICRQVNIIATGVNEPPALDTTTSTAICGDTVVQNGSGGEILITVAAPGAIGPNTGYAGMPNVDVTAVQQIITDFINNSLLPAGCSAFITFL